MKHIVLFSAGLGSWAAAKRVAARYGTANLILLFTDTRMEDEDAYRFLKEGAANVGGELVCLQDGRTSWQVFFDEKFLGNSLVDPCSKILKRELSKRWMEAHFKPAEVVRYVGIDWSESHRYDRIKQRSLPWVVEAPMCEAPYLTKKQVRVWAESEGLTVPRLYDMGFDHNNCGGFCCKAGQAHFANLYRVLPARYLVHEDLEQRFRSVSGKDVSILRREAAGVRRPLTLKEFRLELEAGVVVDSEKHDWGGCSCFAGGENDE